MMMASAYLLSFQSRRPNLPRLTSAGRAIAGVSFCPGRLRVALGGEAQREPVRGAATSSANAGEVGADSWVQWWFAGVSDSLFGFSVSDHRRFTIRCTRPAQTQNDCSENCAVGIDSSCARADVRRAESLIVVAASGINSYGGGIDELTIRHLVRNCAQVPINALILQPRC